MMTPRVACGGSHVRVSFEYGVERTFRSTLIVVIAVLDGGSMGTREAIIVTL